MGRSKRVQRPGERSGGESSRERRAGWARLTFRHAVEQTPDLSGAWQPGLRALREADRNRIDSEDTSRIKGSVDVESCLKTRYRDQRQWDYAVGYRPTNLGAEVVYWIEVHPANPRAFDIVQEKLASLQKWLSEHAAELSAMDKAFVWISSGKTTLGDRQRRLLTLLGLRQVGRFFRIPSEFGV